MRRLQATGVALLVACALGAIAATAAQAEEAPYWSIEGTRLAAGKTFEITAKAVGTEGSEVKKGGVLLPPQAGIEIGCKKVKFAKGAVLLGSNAGEPGKADETIEYSECVQTGAGEPCEVTKGEVKTEPLTNELAYAENKKSLVVTYTPAKGKTYTVVHFTGTGCTLAEAVIKGVVVAGVYTDAEPPVLLELPNGVAQAESFLFSSQRVSKSKIWLIKGGTGAAVETEEITFAGLEGYVSGTLLINLAEKGEPVKRKWSPLL
jgi:hypothetical protein